MSVKREVQRAPRQVKAGMAQHPPDNVGGLVGGVVIEDQVHVELGGNLLVDADEESLELSGAVAPVQRADHFSRGHVQGGEEAGGAVAHIVVTATLRGARHHRQDRLESVERA